MRELGIYLALAMSGSSNSKPALLHYMVGKCRTVSADMCSLILFYFIWDWDNARLQATDKNYLN